MAKTKRRMKEGAVLAFTFIGAVVFLLVLSWWLKHAVWGWVITGVLTAVFIFALVKYPGFRKWVFTKGKKTGEKILYEDAVSGREPVPLEKYSEVMSRANTLCQNPECCYQGKPHIHHIDQDSRDNELSNLIALCPNCHKDAHDGKFSFSQLRNWNRMKKMRGTN